MINMQTPMHLSLGCANTEGSATKLARKWKSHRRQCIYTCLALTILIAQCRTSYQHLVQADYQKRKSLLVRPGWKAWNAKAMMYFWRIARDWSSSLMLPIVQKLSVWSCECLASFPHWIALTYKLQTAQSFYRAEKVENSRPGFGVALRT